MLCMVGLFFWSKSTEKCIQPTDLPFSSLTFSIWKMRIIIMPSSSGSFEDYNRIKFIEIFSARHYIQCFTGINLILITVI